MYDIIRLSLVIDEVIDAVIDVFTKSSITDPRPPVIDAVIDVSSN